MMTEILQNFSKMEWILQKRAGGSEAHDHSSVDVT